MTRTDLQSITTAGVAGGLALWQAWSSTQPATPLDRGRNVALAAALACAGVGAWRAR